jgi:uncharacterized protein (DUF1778 family)
MAPEAKRTLQQAAAVTNKTVSEFLLDSGLNDKAWKAFMKELERPPKDNPGLRKLLGHKPIWEK